MTLTVLDHDDYPFNM